MAEFALVVSVAALLVSGISVLYTRKAAHADTKLAEIEAERRGDEIRAREARQEATRRADVRVRVTLSGTAARLVVTNHGPAAAQRVCAEIPEGQGSPTLVNTDRVDLAPGEHRSVTLIVSLGTSPTFPVKLTWEDGTGEREEWPNVRIPGY